MLSRRELLKGAGAAGAAIIAGRSSRLLAAASQPATPVAFAVPAGACDCHTHVFGDPRRFAFTAARAYTPEQASVEEMRALHRALHIDRVVIVQPSVYGTDNSCTLDGIKRLGSRARGVAVIDQQTTAAALVEMNRAGFAAFVSISQPPARPIPASRANGSRPRSTRSRTSSGTCSFIPSCR